jgi:hypothetical protein
MTKHTSSKLAEANHYTYHADTDPYSIGQHVGMPVATQQQLTQPIVQHVSDQAQ